MSFTVVKGRDGHEVEDAVRRGVADGLARMLAVPAHPVGVQAMLDKDARAEKDGSTTRSSHRPTHGSDRNEG
jgi:hypothetical protein